MNPARTAFITATLVAVALAGCFGDGGYTTCPSDNGVDGRQFAVLETNFGDITMLLHPDKAPVSVENFVRLANEGYYDGTPFFRVYQDWIMQGGAPGGDSEAVRVVVGNGTIPDEPHPGLRFGPVGLMSLANLGVEGSSGSQFFITMGPFSTNYPFNIFGSLVSGVHVIAAINYGAAVPNEPTFTGWPDIDVTLERVSIHCDPPAQVVMNFLTPSQWIVDGTVDYNTAWVWNQHAEPRAGEWRVTQRDGSPLPPGWHVSFATSQATLGPSGYWPPGDQGREYTDWGFSLARIEVPASAKGTTLDASLWFGDSEQPFLLHVTNSTEVVSAPGDTIEVRYQGRTSIDLKDFDSGGFAIEVASGGFIPGFSLGTAGLAVGEVTVLHVPAVMAYGHDIPEGDPVYDLNGQMLDFRIVRTA